MSFGKILLYGLVVIVALGGLSVLVAALRTPSHDRNWKAEYQRLPRAETEGTEITLYNVRDFAFAPGGKISEALYHDRSYQVAELESLWYGISHFTSWGLAHTFLSFGFADGRYLTFSFEARQEVDQHYSPLRGLFGAYELILIASEERDVIGRRTHISKQEVYLYEAELPRDDRVALFEEMLRRINQIHEQPEFYHTLSDNCTISIWRYSRQLPQWRLYTHPKLLLPGYSDEVAYDLGLIANDQPFAATRAAAWIDPAVTTIDDPDYSAKIRQR